MCVCVPARTIDEAIYTFMQETLGNPVHAYIDTVDSHYSGSLKYGHLDIPAIWLGTEC